MISTCPNNAKTIPYEFTKIECLLTFYFTITAFCSCKIHNYLTTKKFIYIAPLKCKCLIYNGKCIYKFIKKY